MRYFCQKAFSCRLYVNTCCRVTAAADGAAVGRDSMLPDKVVPAPWQPGSLCPEILASEVTQARCGTYLPCQQ